MNEDMLLASMDTSALFGLRKRTRAASWIAAGFAVTTLFATLGTLFA